jgi:hypothetical protein
LDLPITVHVEQERLRDQSRLPGEPRGPGLSPTSVPFKMEQQTGQLDVRVPETIDDCDPVLLKNRSRLRGGLVGDEQERSVWAVDGLVHELPGRGCVCPLLDLDGDSSPSSSEVEEGVHAAIRPAGLGNHDQPRDVPEDAERFSLERPHKFH